MCQVPVLALTWTVPIEPYQGLGAVMDFGDQRAVADIDRPILEASGDFVSVAEAELGIADVEPRKPGGPGLPDVLAEDHAAAIGSQWAIAAVSSVPLGDGIQT
jgi:hypothetical protein